MKKWVLLGWIWLAITASPFFNQKAWGEPEPLADSTIKALGDFISALRVEKWDKAADAMIRWCSGVQEYRRVRPEVCFRAFFINFSKDTSLRTGWDKIVLEYIASKAPVDLSRAVHDGDRFWIAAQNILEKRNRTKSLVTGPVASASSKSSGWFSKAACGVLRAVNVVGYVLPFVDVTLDSQQRYYDGMPPDCAKDLKQHTQLAESLFNNQALLEKNKTKNGVSLKDFKESTDGLTINLCFDRLPEYMEQCGTEQTTNFGGGPPLVEPIKTDNPNFPTTVQKYCDQYAPKLKEFEDLNNVQKQKENCDAAADKNVNNEDGEDSSTSTTTSTTMPYLPEESTTSTYLSTTTTMPPSPEGSASTYLPTTTTLETVPEEATTSTTTTLPSDGDATLTTMPNGELLN